MVPRNFKLECKITRKNYRNYITKGPIPLTTNTLRSIWQIYRVRVSCDVVHGAEHVDHAVVQELDFVQVREVRQTLDFLVLHWERAFS